MRRSGVAIVSAVGLGCLVAADASAATVSEYTIAELLQPCVEGDNDSREGAVAEAVCEQYLTGFTDAFLLTGADTEGICLPEQNRPDEIRWAFMKWATQNWNDRGNPAAEGVLATLKTAFPCQ